MLARLQGVFAAAHVPLVAPAPWGPFDAAGAVSMLAARRFDCVFISQRPDGSEAAVCRTLRALAVPVVLLSNATGPLQVNAVRKSSGATLALGAAATDADIVAAFRTMTAEVPATIGERAPLQLPYPTPAAEFDPAWIIARYCLRNSTGSVKLAAKNGNSECTVFLAGGILAAAQTNVRGPLIGELLVRKRLLTADQVERALKLAERKKVRIGAVLVDQGLIAADVVAREASAQYVNRILTVFAWPSVATTVRFEAIPRDDAIIPHTREALIVDGIRRQYDLPRLAALLPATAVFTFAPDAGRRLVSFGFNAKEAAVLGHLDGTRTIAEATALSGSPLDAQRALFASIAFDLVRPPA